MKRTIAISGLHGTGKSSVADRVAQHFDLRRVSAGMIFRRLAKEQGYTLEEFSRIAQNNEAIDRELDARLRTEAETGNVVIDGQLSAWMAGDAADFKILLTAPLEVRVRRIADRDNVDYEAALHETRIRENSERERYQRYYNIDITDLSIYDLVLNTDHFDLDGVVQIVITALEIFFGQ